MRHVLAAQRFTPYIADCISRWHITRAQWRHHETSTATRGRKHISSIWGQIRNGLNRSTVLSCYCPSRATWFWGSSSLIAQQSKHEPGARVAIYPSCTPYAFRALYMTQEPACTSASLPHLISKQTSERKRLGREHNLRRAVCIAE